MSALSAIAQSATDESRQWLTLVERKKVLAVVHTVTYAKRLLDILSLLEADFRLQVAFTAPPHVFGDEVPRYLEQRGIPLLPWGEATHITFDLAVAAGPRGLEEIRAPLITLPHGANYLKRLPGASDAGVAGLRRTDLLPGGKAPAAVVVPHHADLPALARHCPEVLALTHVVGDPVYDRIKASLSRRAMYRRALGLANGEKLVIAVSTWGPHSFFGRFETLLPRLIAELPSERYRTALLVHPNVWSGHGPWQVKTWLARCSRQSVSVVPPEADWRSVLIAADYIIGDHGSVTLYGTLTEAPILLVGSPEAEINPMSPAATLAVTAPALSPTHPLTEQLDYAASEYRRAEYAAIAARITSEPGRFNRNMRRLMYRVMGLGQPAHEPLTLPLPDPPALHTWTSDHGKVTA
ncbi:hypothetical protein [Streptomyces milbemycinicus]|uniref:hypothetical protein n=1 Tax=Streptomyces milbemycinicus TaxID=476552 RepID=UPI0033D0216E